MSWLLLYVCLYVCMYVSVYIVWSAYLWKDSCMGHGREISMSTKCQAGKNFRLCKKKRRNKSKKKRKKKSLKFESDRHDLLWVEGGGKEEKREGREEGKRRGNEGVEVPGRVTLSNEGWGQGWNRDKRYSKQKRKRERESKKEKENQWVCLIKLANYSLVQDQNNYSVMYIV